MSARIPPFPTSPGEVPHGVGLAQLVDAYHRHQRALLVSRSAPARLDAVLTHAVAALALLHALVDRLQAARWATIRTALAADAGRGPEVAAACGLDATEVAAGLRSWADGQVAAGLMTSTEWRVVQLLAQATGGAR